MRPNGGTDTEIATNLLGVHRAREGISGSAETPSLVRVALASLHCDAVG